MSEEQLVARVHGEESSRPVVIYLPGLHGDWTMINSFRRIMVEHVRFVEFTYPRTTTWSLDDYADAILDELDQLHIQHGWLLGESFGSQVAWATIQRNSRPDRFPKVKMHGIILAGGFVKHPWPWGTGALRQVGGSKSLRMVRWGLRLYNESSRLFQNRIPGGKQAADEFRARRTEQDGYAIRNRLTLIDGFDARPVAMSCSIPIYHLTGAIDPIVPWVPVQRWLRQNCPTYAGGKTYWLANHAILSSAPHKSARQCLEWIRSAKTG